MCSELHKQENNKKPFCKVKSRFEEGETERSDSLKFAHFMKNHVVTLKEIDTTLIAQGITEGCQGRMIDGMAYRIYKTAMAESRASRQRKIMKHLEIPIILLKDSKRLCRKGLLNSGKDF